jgi:hypothetical protein
MISNENLYQPNKYKVFLGEGKTVGFCTLWNEPQKIIDECPQILKKSAILGTLYSRQGVNIILRNLALNPQIRKLYIWNHGNLSCSPFGVSGKEILFGLWKNGINENREIPNIDFKIEKEIETAVINKIIKNVSLEEILDEDLKIVAEKIIESHEKAYMEPKSFAESIPEAIDIFPSEQVGFLVHGKTVLDAWIRRNNMLWRVRTVQQRSSTKRRSALRRIR